MWLPEECSEEAESRGDVKELCEVAALRGVGTRV